MSKSLDKSGDGKFVWIGNMFVKIENITYVLRKENEYVIMVGAESLVLSADDGRAVLKLMGDTSDQSAGHASAHDGKAITDGATDGVGVAPPEETKKIDERLHDDRAQRAEKREAKVING